LITPTRTRPASKHGLARFVTQTLGPHLTSDGRLGNLSAAKRKSTCQRAPSSRDEEGPAQPAPARREGKRVRIRSPGRLSTHCKGILCLAGRRGPYGSPQRATTTARHATFAKW